jgi:hypothetical protein
MGDARGLSGGPGCGRGGGNLRVTSGASANKSAPDLFSDTNVAISEGSRPSDCVPRAAIIGSFRLEQFQHPLRTVGCPRRDHPPVGFAECLRRAHSDIVPRQETCSHELPAVSVRIENDLETTPSDEQRKRSARLLLIEQRSRLRLLA